MDGQTNLVTTG